MAKCRILGDSRVKAIDNPKLQTGQVLQVGRAATGYPYEAGEILIVVSCGGDTMVAKLSNGVGYIPTGITSNIVEVRVLNEGQRVELTV